MTIPVIRRLLLRFEKAIRNNESQRSKYPDDPSKFIDSEADLDAAIKSLLPLAQVPRIAYPEFIGTGALQQLVGLLSHENVDIVIDVVELIYEFTDEDSQVDNEGSEDEGQGRDAELKYLVDALIGMSVLELLADNLRRLNETEDVDRQGVFQILGIFENITALEPSVVAKLTEKTNLVKWLLDRIAQTQTDPNRSYAAELLSILLQHENSTRALLGKLGGIEVVLQGCSRYRRHDPVDADDTEFMDNLFNMLCSSFNEPKNLELFREAEGIDLMVLMIKEPLECRTRAMKVLDYALSGTANEEDCKTFIQASGLKWLFQIFAGSSGSKANARSISEQLTYCLGTIVALFTNVGSDSPERIRLLTKFVENDYASIDRLLEAREVATRKLQAFDRDVENKRKAFLDEDEDVRAEMETEWYLQRLDEGLYTLQMTDYILAWLAMEDDGMKGHMESMLARNSKSLKSVCEVLKSQLQGLDEEGQSESNSDLSRRIILQALVGFLEG